MNTNCGSINIPIGSKHNPSGLFLKVYSSDRSYTLNTVHNVSVDLENEQVFVTTTPRITINDSIITKFGLVSSTPINIYDTVLFVIKDHDTDNVLAFEFITNQNFNNKELEINNLVSNTNQTSINLINKKLRLETYSICDETIPCCDKLPSSFTFINSTTSIPCTTTTSTTTTTTPPPFCSNFSLPDTFYITVVGYDLLSNQEVQSLVNRSANVWSTSGTFPCGATFSLSMTCNELARNFSYNGNISCCNQSTKIITDPTNNPLIYPSVRTGRIVTYLDCNGCVNCTTTTSTTTSTTTTTLAPTSGDNSINYRNLAIWNGSIGGNLTTVGSNGKSSYYGTYDQSGNVWEWIDPPSSVAFPIVRDSNFNTSAGNNNKNFADFLPFNSSYQFLGFRIASQNNPLSLSNFVTIGDVSNSGFGGYDGVGHVNYTYRINKYPVTNCEYAKFLNAVDPQGFNPQGIYNTSMNSTVYGGIAFNPSYSNGNKYVVKHNINMGNKPVVYVNWWSAARYCNWLHNGSKMYSSTNPSATSPQNSGSYYLNISNSGWAVKQPDATYYIPTDNEWYKSAYYTPNKNNAGPGYWNWSTQSDNPPLRVTANSIGDGILSGIPARITDYVTCPPLLPTTTTTTTTLPPLDCLPDTPIVITGYIFYTNNRSIKNIPGLGDLVSPCYGGHVCNRTDFAPELIMYEDNSIIPASNNVSLNNDPGGEDVSDTFSFTVRNASVLKAGASIRLKCLSQNNDCHNGVSWVVLTTIVNNQTYLLFNSCVLPNGLDELGFKCEDCCDWDGNTSITINCYGSGNKITLPLQFSKIDDYMWECNQTMYCGADVGLTTVKSILSCNPEYVLSKPPTVNDCIKKWSVLLFDVGCVENENISQGSLLQLCECNKIPEFIWTYSGPNNCGCCPLPCENGVSSCTNFYSDQIIYSYEGSEGGSCASPYISGQQTISIPLSIPLPVVVTLTGGVNDDILINGTVIQSGQFPFTQPPFADICNGAHQVQYCFISNEREFTIATQDNYGFGMSADITIRFCH